MFLSVYQIANIKSIDFLNGFLKLKNNMHHAVINIHITITNLKVSID